MCSVVVKTQSAKICLNFNGGGVFCSSQNSKVPINFIFWGGGVFCSTQNSKTESAKICLNFNWGKGCPVAVKTQKCQDLPKFQYQIPEQGVPANLSKNFALPCHFLEGLGSQIVSHILCMWRLISIF